MDVLLKKKCMYCGKYIKPIEAGNPEDYGLHTPYMDFSDKVVCRECDFVVTQTDRLVKHIVDGYNREYNIERLKEHINAISGIYNN